jgi:hypothetical protein
MIIGHMGNPFWKGFRRKRHLKSFLVKNEDATPVFPELDAAFELIKQGVTFREQGNCKEAEYSPEYSIKEAQIA